jgi:hypothetical protein
VDTNEDAAAVNEAYQILLRKAHLPQDTLIVALPELGKLGTDSHLESAIAAPDDTRKLMCSHSRMLLKRAGQLRVYACAFTDDDTRFDLGTDLSSATKTAVCLQHQRCKQCIYRATTYS